MRKRISLLLLILCLGLLTAAPAAAAPGQTQTESVQEEQTGQTEETAAEEETLPAEASSTSEESTAETPAVPAQPVIVKSLNIYRAGTGKFRAAWTLENVTEEVNVRLYTGQSRTRLSGNLLGGTASGEQGELTVTMPDLDSGYYIFYIVVTAPDGNVSYGYAENTVFFDNTARAEAPAQVYACTNGRTLYIINDEGTALNVDFYEKETGQFLKREVVIDFPATLTLDKAPSYYEVLVSKAVTDKAGRTAYLTLGTSASSYHYIEAQDSITNSSAFEFSLGSLVQGKAEVRAFDEEGERQVNALDNGHFWVKLTEGDNHLTFFAWDSKGGMYADTWSVTLDSEPPLIMLHNGIDVINTDEPVIYLEGEVSKTCVVTLDGEELETVGHCFIARKNLNYGSNEVEISATDEAGNITWLTVTVERTYWTGALIGLIVVVVIGAVLLIVEVTLLGNGVRRRHEHEE